MGSNFLSTLPIPQLFVPALINCICLFTGREIWNKLEGYSGGGDLVAVLAVLCLGTAKFAGVLVRSVGKACRDWVMSQVCLT